MRALKDYAVGELKLVYRILHAALIENSDLLDADLLQDLQADLQQRARADGVDLTDHQAWDRWLGNAEVTCEERMRGRRPLI